MAKISVEPLAAPPITTYRTDRAHCAPSLPHALRFLPSNTAALYRCEKSSAMYVAGAVSAALYERVRSGRGQILSANPTAMATHFVEIDTFFNADGSGCYDESALKKPGAQPKALEVSRWDLNLCLL